MPNLQSSLNLAKPPIAIGFLSEPPASLQQWSGGAQPAGCAFWLKAQQGQSFYTIQSDHYNCAVGSYTHNIPLPADQTPGLEATIGMMVQADYLAMSEVPGIPTLKQSPKVVAYAPVNGDDLPFNADVIIVACNPAQAMLLYEAAIKAGASNGIASALGRPACAVLPMTLNTNSVSLSLGCKGNRTFTTLPDGEMYVSIPADKWQAVTDKLNEALAANDTMGQFYSGRKEQFGA